MVFGQEGDQFLSGGEIEGDVEGLFDQFVDRGLGVLDRQRGQRCQACGDFESCAGQVGKGHHPVDETDPLSLLCTESITREEVLLGASGANQQRPYGGSSVTGDDPHPDVGVRNGRRIGRNDYVAQQGDRGTETYGWPVECRHQRNLDIDKVPDELFGVASQMVEAFHVLQGRKPAKVPSGREGLADTGEDDGARRLFTPEQSEDSGQLVMQEIIHRVEGAGRMGDGQAENVADSLDPDRLQAGRVDGCSGHHGDDNRPCTMNGVNGLDRDKVWKFIDHFTDLAAGAATLGVLAVADRSGLLTALADSEWTTPAQLAGDHFDHRYVEEILSALATSGVVEHDEDTGRFRLPPEHAACLSDPTSPYLMAGWLDLLPSVLSSVDTLAAAVVSGGGVPLESFDDRVVAGLDRSNSPAIRVLLARRWLPSIPELITRLESGIRVADIGCGSGTAALTMARAYPSSTVLGYDVDARAIERANRQAQASGLTNISFEVLTGELIPSGFDLITTFDVIHDLSDPYAVLVRIKEALNPGGTYFMMEPNAASTLSGNINPRGTLLYGVSVLYCLPVSQVGNGTGLGAAWGPVKAEALCRRAGFTQFRRLDIDNPFSAFYEVRP